MPSYVTAKKNTAWIGYIRLSPRAGIGTFQANPTLAAGDVKVSIDGGALANLATLPVVTPSGSDWVKVSLSSSEMNGDNILVQFKDAAGNEWCDDGFTLQTSARQIDDLAFPATSGRSMVVDAAGLVDANTVKVGPTGSGTAQTAGDIPARLPAALVSGRMDASVGAVANNAIAATSFASGAFDAVWSVTTRLLTAGTNIVLAKGTGITGFTDLDASGVRGAVGLASANLDSQIATLATASNLATVANYLDTEIADILADTNELQLAWTVGGRLDLVLAARSSQTSVDDLPTNAELAAALAGADDAVLAAISALTIPTAADNASAVLAKAFEGAETVQDFFRLARAALYGKSVGMETTGPAFRDKADTKSRIQVVGADEFGNRPVVNLDPS